MLFNICLFYFVQFKTKRYCLGLYKRDPLKTAGLTHEIQFALGYVLGTRIDYRFMK